MANEGDKVAALERELVAERQARQALVETSVQLNSLLNLPELLNAIMGSATRLLGAETSSLMLLDETTGELTFTVATGESGARVKDLRVSADHGIAGWVLRHDETAVIDNVAEDPRFLGQIDQLSGFQTRSMLAMPLKIRGKAIGVIEVINKQDSATFSERDRDLAAALGAQAAVAIDNARLYRQLADAVVESRMSYRL